MDPASNLCPVTPGDINIYHARSIADQQITYVLEFSSVLDLDRLNRAAAALARAFPLLSSMLRVEGTRFQRVPAPDYSPGVFLADEVESVSDAVARFTGKACDPASEPPLKLMLIRRSGRDTLCFKADHIATDAAGLKDLLYALAAAYTKGEAGEDFNPERGLGQIFSKFSLLELFHAARKASLPRPGRALIAGPFDAQPTFIEHVSLAPPEYERLRAAAKRAGATINDVLLAALYRAVWQRQDANQAGAFPLMAPVDMRRYLAESRKKVVANLSSAVYPALSAVPGEPFSGTLERMAARMTDFKRNSPGLSALILMRLGAMSGGKRMKARYQIAASHQSRFVCLSNFGVIDPARCNFGTQLVQAYGVGPIQYAPGILIAVSTCANSMHLTLQGNDTQRFQPFIRDFFKSILGELVAWM